MLYLSTVDFLNGTRCPKLLWLSIHRPELATEEDVWATHLKAEGVRVGRLARQLFPYGVLINDGKRSFSEMQAHLKIAMAIDFPAIFNVPTINRELGICCKTDILSLLDENIWALTIVAYSTKVKREHLAALAFQKCCFSDCDFDIRQMNVIHINGSYVRQHELNIEEMFSRVDVTQDVSDLIGGTEKQIHEIKAIISSSDAPFCEIGSCCKYPSKCSYYEYCHSAIPIGSVFELPNHRGKSNILWNAGYKLIKDVPQSFLETDRHLNIQRSAILRSPAIDVAKIGEFLKRLQFPLYFLDFETFAFAIPQFDISAPFQQVPFQYSVHRIDSLESSAEHFEFVADDKQDPRNRLAEALLAILGESGSILTWNKGFELSVLRGLGELFPNRRSPIASVMDRVVDLIVPFRSGWYADLSFKGSFSLKSVMPAVCPYLSYDNLPGIKNGTMASLVYFRFIMGIIPQEDWGSIRKELLAYCHLDTMAMVEIVRHLCKVISDRKLCTNQMN